MESWDDDNFEPAAVLPTLVKSNKWVGEDEDDDVKESWEDEDEEKKDDEEAKQVDSKKKKKSLEERLAEKEAKKKEELEKRLREQAEEDISPEEKLRMQKESDLKMALETTFGEKDEKEDTEIGGLKLPSTSEEFEEFTESLSKQLIPLSRHGNRFVNFTEGLARNLCASMSSSDIKKIKNTLDNLYLEKQKIEKGDKTKKNKGKGKAKLKVEGDNAQLSAYTEYGNDFDDYDDFM